MKENPRFDIICSRVVLRVATDVHCIFRLVDPNVVDAHRCRESQFIQLNHRKVVRETQVGDEILRQVLVRNRLDGDSIPLAPPIPALVRFLSANLPSYPAREETMPDVRC